jgi:hypothetical protein
MRSDSSIASSTCTSLDGLTGRWLPVGFFRRLGHAATGHCRAVRHYPKGSSFPSCSGGPGSPGAGESDRRFLAVFLDGAVGCADHRFLSLVGSPLSFSSVSVVGQPHFINGAVARRGLGPCTCSFPVGPPDRTASGARRPSPRRQRGKCNPRWRLGLGQGLVRELFVSSFPGGTNGIATAGKRRGLFRPHRESDHAPSAWTRLRFLSRAAGLRG